eukprot:scaffold1567_cov102-Cylindrotheca_fusiformis.AAC.5
MPSMEYSRNLERESYDDDDDRFMEHLRFSSSFHSRRSVASDKSNASSTSSSTNSFHGRYDRQRGSNGSYGSQAKRIAGGSNYNHNKKYSRTRRNGLSEESSTRRSTDSKRESCEATCLSTSDNVIALFGAYGTTGQYFLQLALEAGYRVRALVLPGIQLDMPPSKNLTLVTGTLDEVEKIERVIHKASYIVCMLNDCGKILVEKDENGGGSSSLGFIQRLVSILERTRSNRVLLYQASAVALDDNGSTPILSTLVKKMQVRRPKRVALEEQDKIVHYLSSQMDPQSCRYIVTRPSDLIFDKPSKKKLAASKSVSERRMGQSPWSQPGPFPITNIDLAEFSLNALKTEKLYNTCPYVVQDY